MDLTLSFRLLVLVFLTVLVSACSRENDVSIPHQQVNSDVDCSIPLFGDDLILDFKGYSKAADGAISRQYFQTGPLDLADLDQIDVMGVSRRMEPITNQLFLTVDLLDRGTEVTLESNEYGFEVGILRSIALSYDGAESGGLKDEEESAVLFGNDNDYRITISFTIEITDSREECAYLDESLSSGDEGDSSTKVIRTFSDSRTFTLDFIASDNLVTKLNSIPLDDTVFTNDSELGAAVAFNSNWLAIGAPNESSDTLGSLDPDLFTPNMNRVSSGAVFLYRAVNDNWELCRVIKASDAKASDRFGGSLAFGGDILYVGAVGHDGDSSGVFNTSAEQVVQDYSNSDSGAVYGFTILDPCFVEEVFYIKSPDNSALTLASGAGFGSSLAAYKDRLVITSPRQNVEVENNDRQVGRAYLYSTKGDGNVSFLSKLDSIVKHEGELFGASVEINESFVLIGAPGDSTDASVVGATQGVIASGDMNGADLRSSVLDSGAVSVFVINGDLPAFSYYLKPKGLDERDKFGSAVAMTHNYFLASAPNDDSRANVWNTINDGSLDTMEDAGAIYQFEVLERATPQEKVILRNYIKSRHPSVQARFGGKIAADRGWLVATNNTVSFKGNSGLMEYPSLEILPLDPSVDTKYLSVLDQTGSAGGDIIGLDVYGGVIALGMPDQVLNGSQVGAAALWE